MLNETFSLRDAKYSTAELSPDSPRHRWYVIKEAFASKMVESAVSDSSTASDGVICDPFCGSGTVPLTAAEQGKSSYGFEVNPFLAFASRTKLLKCKASVLKAKSAGVLEGVKRGAPSKLEGYSTFTETKALEKWLFNKDVIRSFEGGWKATAAMQNPVRDIIRLALVGAAMDNCNALADGKCLRYRPDWQKSAFKKANFIDSLTRRLAIMEEDLGCEFTGGETNQIIEGDSRKTLRLNSGIKFDLCVTSPPYLNSFDYTDVYRPELFLSKKVTTKEELQELRHHTVRSHVQVKWESPAKRDYGPVFTDVLSRIENKKDQLWNVRLPEMIRAYFEDTEKILRSLKSMAKPKASLWVVVSTSAYGGVEIPVDLIYAHIGQMCGWQLSEVGVLRQLRSSGQHMSATTEGDGTENSRLRESVVIFNSR